MPQWSKYKVADITDNPTIFHPKEYTCDCNCFINLIGTTTVPPHMQYKSVLKVNSTTINTWDISNLSGTGDDKSNLIKTLLFKKGDVISLNKDANHNGGETIITLNILPLE